MSNNQDRQQPATDDILTPDMPSSADAAETSNDDTPIVVVAKGHVALQFGFTGIRVEEIDDAADAEPIVSALLEGGSLLIIIDDRFRADFSPGLLETIDEHRGLPLVVYCPSFEHDVPGAEAAMAAELRRLIGYEIKRESGFLPNKRKSSR